MDALLEDKMKKLQEIKIDVVQGQKPHYVYLIFKSARSGTIQDWHQFHESLKE